MTVTSNSDVIIDAIRDRISSRFAPDHLRAAAVRIGLLLSNNMKIANRRVLRVRTGALINSLQYRIKQTSSGVEVEAGSYNVPYAAIHEYGYNGIMSIRAHQRKSTTAFGRKVNPFIQNVRAHSRKMNMPARPYVGPGFEKSKPYIINILRELLK